MHFHFGHSLHVTVLEIHIQFHGSRNRVDGTGDTDREAVGASVVHPGETRGPRKLELLVAGVMELCPRMRSSLCFRYCAGDMLCQRLKARVNALISA